MFKKYFKNHKSHSYSVALATGGTGGHIFPAIALANALDSKGIKTFFITDNRGKALIPSNYFKKVIIAETLSNKSLLIKIINVLKLKVGFLQSLHFLFLSKPNFIIGFGGYPSIGPIIAGWFLKIPSLIHEQNAIVGRANKILSRFSLCLMYSWKNTKNLPINSLNIFTGLPVRKEFSKKFKRVPNKKFNILILGGTQGARIFGENIPKSIIKLPSEIRNNLFLYHQVRNEQIEKISKFYENNKINSITRTFFYDISKIYRKADLVICRSGASSIAELSFVGKASILIPFNKAMDNHQMENAKLLEEINGTIIFNENHFTTNKFSNLIYQIILDKRKRSKLEKNSTLLSNSNSTKIILNLLSNIHVNKKIIGEKI